MSPVRFRAACAAAILCGLGGIAWLDRLDRERPFSVLAPPGAPRSPALAPAGPSASAPRAPEGAGAPARDPAAAAESAAGFAAVVGMLSGSVSRCSPEEHRLINACGARVLENWGAFTGMAEISDPATREALSGVWARSAQAGRRHADEAGFSCGDLLAASRHAPIWSLCPRPDDAPSEAAPDALRIQ